MKDATRLVHEGRCWLEETGQLHLVDDPYTREEVLTVVERHYPRSGHVRGVAALARDLEGGTASSAQRVREYRERRAERLIRLAPGSRVEPGATVESRR